MGEYVIALDQGTTSSRAVLIDRLGRIKGMSQSPFPQLFPQPGWVEHSPKDILSSQLKVLAELLVSTGVSASQIDSIGITNQRETTVVWDRVTGEPIHNAIVWQCRRTTEIVERCCSDAETAAEVTHRTTPLRKSLGSWMRCPVRVSAPKPASWLSARWILGLFGI